MVRAIDALARELDGRHGDEPSGARPLGARFLDGVRSELAEGRHERGMQDLFSGLLLLRSLLPPEEWLGFARGVAIEHPLRSVIHQDPMSRRSFEKPRGYAGDAPLLDYIYRLDRPRPSDGLGLAVYAYATSRPAAAGVRERMRHLARAIDACAVRSGRPIRVLSIASGHLREAGLSEAVRAGRVSEIVALDGDAESLAEVESSLAGVRVRTVCQSVRRLIARRPDWGSFDLVYSAGLYDYLPDRTARILTARMLEMCVPGGRVIFTNFLPTVPDAGYMESYMGWELIYRTLADLEALLPTDGVAALRTFADDGEAIGYLEADRAQYGTTGR